MRIGLAMISFYYFICNNERPDPNAFLDLPPSSQRPELNDVDRISPKIKYIIKTI